MAQKAGIDPFMDAFVYFVGWSFVRTMAAEVREKNRPAFLPFFFSHSADNQIGEQAHDDSGGVNSDTREQEGTQSDGPTCVTSW
jgi:hypothetical protein